jgi:hypothetical protein
MPTRDIGRLQSIGLMLVMLVALWLLVGCAGSPEDKSKQQSTPPVAGNFVGEAPDADALVAIISSGPEQEGDAEHEVRAYLCDGKTINEWFVGKASGNDLDLSSESGAARLKGTLTPETSTGTITLADGRSLTFTANPATGVAGLYNVTVSDDGQLRGTSETGGRIEGRLGTQAASGYYPISGTLTPPGGGAQNFQASSTTAEAGDFRGIVLTADRIRGASKGEGGGFISSGSLGGIQAGRSG